MLTYDLTKIGSDSLYQSLYKQIRADIVKGKLKPGEKLPSKRDFAAQLGVSVITIESAYAQLISEGYLYALPKRGFFVSDFKAHLVPQEPVLAKEAAPHPGENARYFADFSSNQTESGLFPFTIWSKVIRELLSDSRVQLMTRPAGASARCARALPGISGTFGACPSGRNRSSSARAPSICTAC